MFPVFVLVLLMIHGTQSSFPHNASGSRHRKEYLSHFYLLQKKKLEPAQKFRRMDSDSLNSINFLNNCNQIMIICTWILCQGHKNAGVFSDLIKFAGIFSHTSHHVTSKHPISEEVTEMK